MLIKPWGPFVLDHEIQQYYGRTGPLTRNYVCRKLGLDFGKMKKSPGSTLRNTGTVQYVHILKYESEK